MAYYFVIIGTRDNPLYEAQLSSSKFPVPAPLPPNVASATSLFDTGAVPGYGHKNSKHVMQVVAHASLDIIENVQWTSSTMYLKGIDRFHEWNVSAWATPGGMKLVLLYDTKNDDGNRLFLHEAWESYVKHALNPFYDINAVIRSKTFDAKIKASARKHL